MASACLESGAVPPVGSRGKAHGQGSGAKPSKAEAISLIEYVIFCFFQAQSFISLSHLCSAIFI